MSVLGIIAEYDPFHLGHQRHLLLARRALQPSETLILLSGCFRQRGEAALLLPHDRAACALESGADAVLSLPVLYTLRSAMDYAFAAVSLLSSLGCTHISFGAETEDLSLLRRAAALLEDQPEAFRRALRDTLDTGAGYPHALEIALGSDASFTPELARLLSLPNNTLALCYLRALRRLRSPMLPLVIRRPGAYSSESVDAQSPSASALRSALERGAYDQALGALPDCSQKILRQALLTRRIFHPRPLDTLLLARLRTMTLEEAADLPDVSEGLERRLLKEARSAQSREELLSAVSSRRYSAARVSRLCACALLNIRASDPARAAEGPEETLLLALRPDRNITSRWRDLSVTVLSSLSDTKNPPLWRADLQAWKTWALCAGLPDTLPWSERIYTPEKP